MRVTWNSSIL